MGTVKDALIEHGVKDEGCQVRLLTSFMTLGNFNPQGPFSHL